MGVHISSLIPPGRVEEEPRSLRWLNARSSRPFAFVVIIVSCDWRGGWGGGGGGRWRENVLVSGDEGRRRINERLEPRSRLSREAKAVWVNDLVASDFGLVLSEVVPHDGQHPPSPPPPPQPLAFVVYPLWTLHSISAQLLDWVAGEEDGESCKPNSEAIYPYYTGREPHMRSAVYSNSGAPVDVQWLTMSGRNRYTI